MPVVDPFCDANYMILCVNLDTVDYVAASIWEVKMKKIIGTAALCAAVMASGSAFAFECKRGEASFDNPAGFQSVL